MSATSFDLRQVDLLTLLAARTTLKKVATTNGGEFAGACPWCGGDDRFRVWPFRDKPGYWCRQCGQEGDAIDYVRSIEGLDFEQAVERLQLRSPAAPPRGPTVRQTKTTVYELRNAAGEKIAEHVRFDMDDGSKRFAYRRQGTNGLDGMDPSDLPLYGSEQTTGWVRGQPVIVVEGEKKRDMLVTLGFYSLGTLGSNTTPNDDALNVLRDFDVILSPDNDENNKLGPVGWKHMDRVARRLVNMGIRPRIVDAGAVFPPEGGGIDDYLAAGHTRADVEALLAAATLYTDDGADVVTQRDEITFEVDLPANDGGRVVLLAEDVSWERHSLTADITIQLRAGAAYSQRYGTRLDFRSASGRESAARELGRILGGGPKGGENWTGHIMKAGLLIRDRIQTYDPTIDMFDLEVQPDDIRYRVSSLIEEGESTMIFGDGSSCKSYLLLWLLLLAGWGGEQAGLEVSHPGPVLFVDYETNAKTVRQRLGRLMRGFGYNLPPGLFHYFPALGRPLTSLVPVLRKRIRENDIGLVGIDSAAFACDDEPEKSISATRYFNAAKRLGVTTVHVAHINRSGDDEKPFGSVFWHNSARATWNVKRVQRQDHSEIHVGLYNRKANNDATRPKPLAFTLHFDDRDHTRGAVSITAADPKDDPELARELPLREQIRDLLGNGAALPTKVIASHVGKPEAYVRKVLDAGRDTLYNCWTGPGGRGNTWTLLAGAGETPDA